MDFLTNLVGSIQWETIAQLTMLALIVIAGPAVILSWRFGVAICRNSLSFYSAFTALTSTTARGAVGKSYPTGPFLH